MQIIENTDELARICAEFAKSPYITVDTEFLRERTYWPQLCLVQMARPGGNGADDAVLIDPLAEDIDISPLWGLMSDESTVKVFHAGRQDIEIFWRLGEVIPTPVFDTQIAAMVCGFGEQVGYETLARKIAKADIDKSSRFTDWSRRPLSHKQMDYALADVTHLRVVYETLSARIREADRAHWMTEELAILTDPATYDNAPANAWRRVKARSSKPGFLAVVRALAAWRETKAQACDVPRGRILKDDALLEIATAKPSTPEELNRLRLVRRETRKPETAGEVLSAVRAGLACPPDDWPEPPSPPGRREGSSAIADLLKVFLKARADRIGVAPRLIATASEIEALAGEDEPDVALLKGWRREVFGEDALRVKRGEVGLVARPGGVIVVDLPDDAPEAPGADG